MSAEDLNDFLDDKYPISKDEIGTATFALSGIAIGYGTKVVTYGIKAGGASVPLSVKALIGTNSALLGIGGVSTITGQVPKEAAAVSIVVSSFATVLGGPFIGGLAAVAVDLLSKIPSSAADGITTYAADGYWGLEFLGETSGSTSEAPSNSDTNEVITNPNPGSPDERAAATGLTIDNSDRDPPGAGMTGTGGNPQKDGDLGGSVVTRPSTPAATATIHVFASRGQGTMTYGTSVPPGDFNSLLARLPAAIMPRTPYARRWARSLGPPLGFRGILILAREISDGCFTATVIAESKKRDLVCFGRNLAVQPKSSPPSRR